MSEEDLRQQIRELKKENARLHQEKMQLMMTASDLLNKLSALRERKTEPGTE